MVASPYALLGPQVLATLMSMGVGSASVDAGATDIDTAGPLLLLTDCRCQPGSAGGFFSLNTVPSL